MHITTWYDYDEKCIINITVMRWWHYTLKMNIYEIIAFIKIKEPTAKVLLPIGTNRREDNNNKKTQCTAVMVQKLGFFFIVWVDHHSRWLFLVTSPKPNIRLTIIYCVCGLVVAPTKREEIFHTLIRCAVCNPQSREIEKEKRCSFWSFLCAIFIYWLTFIALVRFLAWSLGWNTGITTETKSRIV